MSSEPLPDVSVIIPVRDDTERLLRCLERLEAQSYRAESVEVIVVDNGSREPLAGRVPARAGLKVVSEPRFGSYAARNRGAREARGTVLAFTDSDCLPEPGWLEMGVAVLMETPEALIAGHIEVFPRNASAPTAVEQYEMMFAFRQKRYAEEFGFGATANVFVNRHVFESAGGFVETLMSGGDHDFGARLDAAGHPILYCAGAVVRHPARRTWSELYAKTVRTTKGRLQRGSAVRRPRPRFSDLRYYLGCNMRVLRSSLPVYSKAKVMLVLFLVTGLGPWLRWGLKLRARSEG